MWRKETARMKENKTPKEPSKIEISNPSEAELKTLVYRVLRDSLRKSRGMPWGHHTHLLSLRGHLPRPRDGGAGPP